MRKLERRHVIEFSRLLLDRSNDRRAIMPGVAAPQAGAAIEDLAAVGGHVVHVLSPREYARRGLEGAVRREGHPEGFEVVGGGRRHHSILRHARA